MNNTCSLIEETLLRNPKGVYESVKEMTEKGRRGIAAAVENEDGMLLTETDKLRSSWKEYCKNCTTTE